MHYVSSTKHALRSHRHAEVKWVAISTGCLKTTFSVFSIVSAKRRRYILLRCYLCILEVSCISPLHQSLDAKSAMRYRIEDDQNISVNGKKIRIVSSRNPLELPWKDFVSSPWPMITSLSTWTTGLCFKAIVVPTGAIPTWVQFQELLTDFVFLKCWASLCKHIGWPYHVFVKFNSTLCSC